MFLQQLAAHIRALFRLMCIFCLSTPVCVIFSAEVLTDYSLLYWLLCYFQVKLAEFSKTPEDFLRKYEELKSKNVRNLDPLVYLLSKLCEDKEVIRR